MAKTEKTKPEANREANSLPLPDPNQSLPQQAPDILLAMCLFGEARGEDDRTRRAVAQVALNRARHPHRVFGSRRDASLEDNLRRVILKPWQFSCFNPDDPNYAKLLRPLDYEEPAVWARCLECARQALAAADQPDTLTANSDHYFDESLQPPSWAKPAQQTARIGRLRFYRLYLPAVGRERSPAERKSSREAARPVQDGRTVEAAPFQSPPPTLLAAAPAARMRLPALSAKRGATAGACPHVSLPAPRHPLGRINGLMKNRWFSGSGRLSLLMLLLGAVLSGCSDFERAAYRTLAVSQAEYETVQQRAVEAFLHGLMSEEQWNRFEVEAHRFIEAHNAAVDAFDLWSQAKNKNNEARLQAMLEILPRLVREINTLVESFEKKEREVRSQKSEESHRDTEDKIFEHRKFSSFFFHSFISPSVISVPLWLSNSGF